MSGGLYLQIQLSHGTQAVNLRCQPDQAKGLGEVATLTSSQKPMTWAEVNQATSWIAWWGKGEAMAYIPAQ